MRAHRQRSSSGTASCLMMRRCGVGWCACAALRQQSRPQSVGNTRSTQCVCVHSSSSSSAAAAVVAAMLPRTIQHQSSSVQLQQQVERIRRGSTSVPLGDDRRDDNGTTTGLLACHAHILCTARAHMHAHIYAHKEQLCVSTRLAGWLAGVSVSLCKYYRM